MKIIILILLVFLAGCSKDDRILENDFFFKGIWINPKEHNKLTITADSIRFKVSIIKSTSDYYEFTGYYCKYDNINCLSLPKGQIMKHYMNAIKDSDYMNGLFKMDKYGVITGNSYSGDHSKAKIELGLKP